MSFRLIATSAFGLEAVVARELHALGYEAKTVRPGRIAFAGDAAAICRANLWLRSADRVLVELAEFACPDFDALFDTTRELPWEGWIAGDAAMPVRGRSHRSQLTSVPAIQRTVKKAMVERLLAAGGALSLPETGPPAPVEISIIDDTASVDLDTTGAGLHRRGYRTLSAEAQLRETLAAALVQLSFYSDGKALIDPFCGTGTIVIEAAMIGRNLAPGRNREFAAEHFDAVPAAAWQAAREEASDLARPALVERIIGTDSSSEALKLARHHAELAGVHHDVHFQQRDFAELSSSKHYGCVITNPPYGVRLGEDREIAALYRTIPEVLRRLPTWSHFLLSAREDFEELVGQRADRRRKLYNGRIACTYFQYHGPKPKKRRTSDAVSERELPREGEAPAEPESPTGAGSAGASPSRGRGVDQSTAQPAKRPAFGGLREEAQRQATEFANRLRNRARHLRRWPKRGITCFRLYERDIPEAPLVVDRYEDALHIAEFERPHDRTPAEHADWLDLMARTAAETLEVARDNVFMKVRRRQKGESQYERVDDRQATRVVQEGGLKFLINLSDYLDTGLFLDHRVTRGMFRDAADGKRVLNLFAYTGAFTVYAAAGGAATTTTVDLSGNYLDWAAENMQLNGFEVSGDPGAQHRFVRADAGDFLGDLPAEPLFDLAIVDPPTFSNSKRLEEDWDVQRHHAGLLLDVLERMPAGGVIFFSTNSRRFKLDEDPLAAVATLREISNQTVPEDFRNRRIHRCWRIVKK